MSVRPCQDVIRDAWDQFRPPARTQDYPQTDWNRKSFFSDSRAEQVRQPVVCRRAVRKAGLLSDPHHRHHASVVGSEWRRQTRFVYLQRPYAPREDQVDPFHWYGRTVGEVFVV